MSAPTVEELLVQVVFLETLQRAPTPTELSLYAPQITAGTLTAVDLTAQLQDTTEYKKVSGTFHGDIAYDEAYTLTLTDIYGAGYNPVVLGNGKIAAITSPRPGTLDKQFISTRYDFNTMGHYSRNVTETFNAATVQLFSRDPADVTFGAQTQTLQMANGIFTSAYTVTTADGSSPVVSVTHTTAVLYPYPYCTLYTITLESASDCTVPLFHTLQTPETIDNPVYTYNTIYSYTETGGRNPLTSFMATGVIHDTSSPIANLNTYMFDAPTTGRPGAPAGSFRHQGYNQLRSDPRVAFASLEVDLVAGVPYVFHVLSTTMTGADFARPDVEVQRITVHLANRPMLDLRAEHVNMWSVMWESRIDIEPKDNITGPDRAKLIEVRRAINTALYNIHCVVRQDVNVEVNPLNLSTIDLTGHIFWAGELWLIPALLYIKPRAARTLLDYRYNQLETAKQLAASMGYKGSKYAYENDTVGYTDVYWDSVSPLSIFNTALISISVWNYYRVSRDLDWLRKKGYAMLKSNAEFFLSKLEYDPADNLFHLRNVVGLNTGVVNDSAMTNYMARLAIKYAAEAGYELGYYVDTAWVPTMQSIYLPILDEVEDPRATPAPTTRYNIITPSFNDDGTTTTATFLEELIPLIPYYSREFFALSPTVFNHDTLKDNYAFHIARVKPAFTTNAVNTFVRAMVTGAISQQEPLYNDRYDWAEAALTLLYGGSTTPVIPPWGSMQNSAFASTRYNDVGMSALVVLTLVSSIGGIIIRGGVTPSRFYYEDFGMISKSTNVLPPSWKKVTFRGIGNGAETFTVVNALYYNP